MARVLALAVAVWLGEISYGIYIVHTPLWDLLGKVARTTLQVAPGNPLLAVVYAILILGVCGLSFRFIERPARQAIRRMWDEPAHSVVPSEMLPSQAVAHR
ncbi:MAG TPA: hypothetical protein VGP82_13395 [Ktedonobacterales bacterium]|nr:hypothetical protein [Ktedonobacterales bacterium]